ncbi:hypothetical protein SBA4_2200003 [Candidatus Sulfopaludibacter sp. SbA4]|nr:hypothetical protein SBA4_2200003 [Candidatus Sulfopaludibacter sp. SbA4]
MGVVGVQSLSRPRSQNQPGNRLGSGQRHAASFNRTLNFEVLVTCGQSFPQQQNLSKYRIGMLLLNGPNEPQIFEEAIAQVDQALEAIKPGQAIEVAPRYPRIRAWNPIRSSSPARWSMQSTRSKSIPTAATTAY